MIRRMFKILIELVILKLLVIQQMEKDAIRYLAIICCNQTLANDLTLRLIQLYFILK